MRDTKSYKWDAFRPKGGLEVQEILAVQKKIVPELVDVLEKRYNIKIVWKIQFYLHLLR